MTECKRSDPVKRRRALWGIIALFSVAGACAGFAGGIMVTSLKASNEVATIRQTYHEALESRKASLELCLRVAPKAARDAAQAADRAADAARQAAGQARADELRIEGEDRK